MKEKLQEVTVRLPADDAAKARRLASQMHTSQAAIYRIAIHAFLEGDHAAHTRDAAMFARATFELVLAMTPREGRETTRKTAVAKALQGLKRGETAHAHQVGQE